MWLSLEASGGGLGQCGFPSPLVEGRWSEGGGDAEMCRVGTGRDVPRVMGAGMGPEKRLCDQGGPLGGGVLRADS